MKSVIWDRVHDLVQLPSVVRRAIDTPEFQRLRLLKQLGIVSYVFPGAAHTRFEHSVGVAHLSRTLARQLRENQPDLAGALSPHDEELAMLAGLCHDVGHGPFSHLFEDVIARNIGVPFDHEAMSLVLTRRMLRGIIPEEEIEDVLGIMRGAARRDDAGNRLTNRWEGPRGVLCDVVANKRCGVDVDKLDYFLRDSLSCYGRPTVDARYARLFHGVRAVQGDSDDAPGHWRLAFDTKVARDLRELWSLRAKLHAGVYQTPVVKAVGHMIGDALQLAEPHFLIDGKGLRMRDCLVAGAEDHFLKLGDWIVDAISASGDPALAPAIRILQHLRRRELYPKVAQFTLTPGASLVHSDHIAAQVLARIEDLRTREQVQALLITDVAHLTPAKAHDDDPLSRVTWVKLKGFTGPSTALRPLRRDGVAPSSVFSPSTHVERHVVLLLRRESLRKAEDGIALTPALQTVATAAAAKWIAERTAQGDVQTEALVPAW